MWTVMFLSLHFSSFLWKGTYRVTSLSLSPLTDFHKNEPTPTQVAAKWKCRLKHQCQIIPLQNKGLGSRLKYNNCILPRAVWVIAVPLCNESLDKAQEEAYGLRLPVVIQDPQRERNTETFSEPALSEPRAEQVRKSFIFLLRNRKKRKQYWLWLPVDFVEGVKSKNIKIKQQIFA